MHRHFIQLQILSELLSNPSAKFGELNVHDFPSDQFNFHLQTLYKQGLLEKSEDGEYSLSDKGMEEAGRLNITDALPIKQPKLGITLGIFRNDDQEVLVLRRTRAQSLGKIAWYDRKWRFGNSIETEINELLLAETGLTTDNYAFAGVTHVIRGEGKNIEIDAVMVNFKVVDPQGELIKEGKDGNNEWMSVEEVKQIPDDKKLIGYNERLDAFLAGKAMLQEFV